MANLDSKARFSGRVADYVAFRPRYPEAVYVQMLERVKRSGSLDIADIGSGPGLSAEPLLKRGHRVRCVEPNADMRSAAVEILGKYEGFFNINGTGEATTLADASMDIVLCAQAFHWLDRAKASSEFRRAARAGGVIAILWNERKTDATPFLREYEALLHRCGSDYAKVAQASYPVTAEALSILFDAPFTKEVFENRQTFDLNGFVGRAMSSSYVPGEGEANYEAMQAGLRYVFDRHAQDGKVTFEYDTEVFLTSV